MRNRSVRDAHSRRSGRKGERAEPGRRGARLRCARVGGTTARQPRGGGAPTCAALGRGPVQDLDPNTLVDRRGNSRRRRQAGKPEECGLLEARDKSVQRMAIRPAASGWSDTRVAASGQSCFCAGPGNKAARKGVERGPRARSSLSFARAVASCLRNAKSTELKGNENCEGAHSMSQRVKKSFDTCFLMESCKHTEDSMNPQDLSPSLTHRGGRPCSSAPLACPPIL